MEPNYLGFENREDLVHEVLMAEIEWDDRTKAKILCALFGWSDDPTYNEIEKAHKIIENNRLSNLRN